jgi:hypothetical protein
MTEQHPITPPPELIAKWASSMCGYYEAARWGADQELEACVEWLRNENWTTSLLNMIRAARRPKPPSLKEQALQALYRFDDTEGHEGLTPEQIADDFVLIRLALEQLDD